MRKILFLLPIIGISLAVKAQQTEIGLRMGPNHNTIRGNEFFRQYHDALLGFSTGIQVQLLAQNKVSFIAALQYEKNGSKVKDVQLTDAFGNIIGEGDVYNHFDYLVLPLMARYSIGSKTKFFMNGGPFLGYLINNKVVTKQKESTSGGSGTMITSGPNNYKSLNMGLSAGLGLRIPVNNNLDLETSFENHLGLYPIDDSEAPRNAHLKTNSINFYVGLSYKF